MLLYCASAAGQRVCLAWPGDPLLAGGFPTRTAPACGLASGQSCSLLCLCQSPRGLKGQSWSPSSSLNPQTLALHELYLCLSLSLWYHFTLMACSISSLHNPPHTLCPTHTLQLRWPLCGSVCVSRCVWPHIKLVSILVNEFFALTVCPSEWYQHLSCSTALCTTHSEHQREREKCCLGSLGWFWSCVVLHSVLIRFFSLRWIISYNESKPQKHALHIYNEHTYMPTQKDVFMEGHRKKCSYRIPCFCCMYICAARFDAFQQFTFPLSPCAVLFKNLR